MFWIQLNIMRYLQISKPSCSHVMFVIFTYCYCNDYEVFENFEWSQITLSWEQKMVRRFLEHKRYLGNKKQIIKKLTNNSSLTITKRFFAINRIDFKHNIITKKCMLEYFNLKHLIYRSVADEMVHTLPMREVIESAARGVVTLYAVYPNNFVLYDRGHLSSQNGKAGHGRGIDYLETDDLMLMSYIATNHLNWCDTGMKYLKASLHTLNSFRTKHQMKSSDRVHELMMFMIRYYPIRHNDILREKKHPIGPGWKCFPFEISSGIHATSTLNVKF